MGLKRWLLASILSVVGSASVPPNSRWRLYRALGLDVKRCGIYRGLVVDSRNIRIGQGAFINSGVLLEGWGGIWIGRNVDIAPRVSILTSTHNPGGPQRRAGSLSSSPVVIHEGCWIGTAAVILPGVTVGAGAVIAAGAVVVTDVAENSMVAGVPARVVKRNIDDGGGHGRLRTLVNEVRE